MFTPSGYSGRASNDAPAHDGLRLLLMALLLALVYHGGLLPFTHGNTYDAFIHMFFADSYHRSWFDVWEPRWYTGFATTSYPPGTHMMQAALMNVMPLRWAFVVVQLSGILLLTVGVYRFACLWVHERAAGYAALAAVLASSISETVHLFGQLPTIVSLSLFLNGMPWVFRWISSGGWTNLGAAVALSAATTAAHHVTTIFGGVLFVFPLALHAWATYLRRTPTNGKPIWRRVLIWLKPVGRGLILGALMVGAMILTVFPYWAWSISDPITQVPIPHGSRESFLVRTDLGLMFFLIPWGVPLLFLPHVAYKTFTTRLWPLGGAVLFCFVLGTGGTTPIPRAILRGAFDILTLDRFTFWATILILPFLGLLFDSLLHGRARRILRQAIGPLLHRAAIAGLFTSMALVSAMTAVLPTFRPTQPVFIDPAPIVNFLESDEHDHWRYLTLGFGDQFAYLAAQTTAQSVDGNYHSARRLPDLTRYSVERLENAKYLGVPGLGSLRQFLVNAERYNLKYVFSNDAFYDPLLWFTGWKPLNRLQNNVVVWERPDMPPLPRVIPRRDYPAVHLTMWGTLPPLMLALAALVLLGAAVRARHARPQPTDHIAPVKQTYPNPTAVRGLVISLAVLATLSISGVTSYAVIQARKPATPEQVITHYFTHLDFRRFDKAHALLDPQTRASLEDTLFAWRWTGGLLASYGKLTDLRVTDISRQGKLIDATVELDWLTALDLRTQTVDLRLVERDGRWVITPLHLRPLQTPLRLQRSAGTNWTTSGRRQALPETDMHRDRLDRPRIGLWGARMVRYNDLLSVVGQVTNADADPGHLTIIAEAQAQGAPQARETAATVAPHRLRPAETGGFRVTFENVLSLEDAEARGAFDPTMFIPPTFGTAPDGAFIEARALVSTDGLYRGIALNDLRVTQGTDGLHLTGLATNTGAQTATLSGINALLYDLDGLPIWAETGFLDSNLYPGQSTPFSLTLPPRNSIEIVAEVPFDKMMINGSTQQTDLTLPDAGDGTLPLPSATGYAALRVHVATMTYEPLL